MTEFSNRPDALNNYNEKIEKAKLAIKYTEGVFS